MPKFYNYAHVEGYIDFLEQKLGRIVNTTDAARWFLGELHGMSDDYVERYLKGEQSLPDSKSKEFDWVLRIVKRRLDKAKESA